MHCPKFVGGISTRPFAGTGLISNLFFATCFMLKKSKQHVLNILVTYQINFI